MLTGNLCVEGLCVDEETVHVEDAVVNVVDGGGSSSGGGACRDDGRGSRRGHGHNYYGGIR